MRTTKQVIETSNISAKLIRSVIRQLGGKESLEDIMNHGVDGGFNGFIWFSDTVPFFKRNRQDILKLVERYADDFGVSSMAIVAEFNCLKTTNPKEKFELEKKSLRCLYGKMTDEDDIVANALAWFAAEEVARAFCDE